jgi:hypothetical protein
LVLLHELANITRRLGLHLLLGLLLLKEIAHSSSSSKVATKAAHSAEGLVLPAHASASVQRRSAATHRG